MVTDVTQCRKGQQRLETNIRLDDIIDLVESFFSNSQPMAMKLSLRVTFGSVTSFSTNVLKEVVAVKNISWGPQQLAQTSKILPCVKFS